MAVKPQIVENTAMSATYEPVGRGFESLTARQKQKAHNQAKIRSVVGFFYAQNRKNHYAKLRKTIHFIAFEVWQKVWQFLWQRKTPDLLIEDSRSGVCRNNKQIKRREKMKPHLGGSLYRKNNEYVMLSANSFRIKGTYLRMRGAITVFYHLYFNRHGYQ